jgi:N-acetylmuramate 1-kinase|tara:strand:- start:7566 stop:8579 length:1014 start_codon:yes stop_codon:yes gene_type:complete
MDTRLTELSQWASGHFVQSGQPKLAPADFVVVSDDASFRRYYRCPKLARSMVFMDAPPEKEPIIDFLAIGKALSAAGLPAPDFFAVEVDAGFLALSDFGDQQLLSVVQDHPEAVLSTLSEVMGHLNQVARVDCALPDYSESLLRAEMDLFPTWYLTNLLGLTLTDAFWSVWADVCDRLVASALSEPQVFVHRDFHSRNIMVPSTGEIGLLDFQDAVRGPLSYDLVSLLKDCYVEYDPAVQQSLVQIYRQYWLDDPRVESSTPEAFFQAFELMGLQRHLKCAGIFARLCLRDGKSRYLHDIPLVLKYIAAVCESQPILHDFHQWLQAFVLPDRTGGSE